MRRTTNCREGGECGSSSALCRASAEPFEVGQRHKYMLAAGVLLFSFVPFSAVIRTSFRNLTGSQKICGAIRRIASREWQYCRAWRHPHLPMRMAHISPTVSSRATIEEKRSVSIRSSASKLQYPCLGSARSLCPFQALCERIFAPAGISPELCRVSSS